MSIIKELQLKLQLNEIIIKKQELELEIIKNEWDKHIDFVSLINKTIQNIYDQYPHILTECCANKNLIESLKIAQKINKIQKNKQEGGLQ